MNKNHDSLEYSKILCSMKELHTERQIGSVRSRDPQSMHEIEKSNDHKAKVLNEAILKIKVNDLVEQFAYKIKRNIPLEDPVQYQTIQKKLLKRKRQENYCKPFHLPEELKAFFMGLDIVCLLAIQTLAAFQGFYEEHRNRDTISLAVTAAQFVCLTVFVAKIMMGILTSKIVSKSHNRYLVHTALAYLGSRYFVEDLVILIGTILKIVLPHSQTVGIVVFLLSILTISSIRLNIEIIETVFVDNFKKKQYFGMFKLTLFNVFFSQFVSTILISLTFFDENNNWITRAIDNGVLPPDSPWWHEYITAVYWSIVTTTTVGYGDVLPANYFETIIISVLMLTGTIVLSYNISEISNIISNLRSIDLRRKEETAIFKRIARDQKLPFDLQDRILVYIRKSSEVRAQFEFLERKSFIEKLPETLRESFQSEYARNIFSKTPFFKLLEHKTLTRLAQKLKSEVYYPGEPMTDKNIRFKKILFLKEGVVGFAYFRPNSILNGLVLQKREIVSKSNAPYLLNKYLLTHDRDINYQVLAQSYCFVLALEFQEFMATLRENDKDIQFYCQLYNKISFIDQEWDLFECDYCSPKRHSVFLCPKLHYMPYKTMVIHRYIFGKTQGQTGNKMFKRKTNRSYKKHTLLYWKNLFKHYEHKWEVREQKSLHKRAVSNESLFNTNQDWIQDGYEKTLSKEEILIERVAQRVLKRHCCSKISEEEVGVEQFDRMHDFNHFFPNFNPSHLTFFTLSTSNRHRYRNVKGVHKK